MSTRIGDAVFFPSGKPGVVTNRTPETGKVTVEAQPDFVRNSLRNGYINGLSIPQRQEFMAFMDKVKETPDPELRMEQLQAKINELNTDPRNHVLTRYLTGEMAHIMYTADIKPKTYEVDPFRLR